MEFVAGVSHELRSPLAVIQSAGSNLSRGVIGDARRTQQYGTLIQKEARRLSHMVEQILGYAGIQSGREQYDFRRLEIPPLVDRVLSHFSQAFEEGSWVVEKEIPEDLPPVWGDARALEGCLRNLVEDEPGLVLTLTDLLASEGYEVRACGDGEEAVQLASERPFDLILLDVMLPGKDGFDVCRDLRRHGIQAPVLMLTARDQVVDKVLELKLGADDYLTKPFENLELLARMAALLRRASAPALPGDVFRFGPVTVDFRSTEVSRDGRFVELSAREFELLRYFIRNQGATVSRQQLLRDVWGYERGVSTRTVDVHVALLRQKLEEDPKNPRYLHTVRGFGYRFGDSPLTRT